MSRPYPFNIRGIILAKKIFFSHTKPAPAISQSAVLFSHNKSTSVTSHSTTNRVRFPATTSLLDYFLKAILAAVYMLFLRAE